MEFEIFKILKLLVLRKVFSTTTSFHRYSPLVKSLNIFDLRINNGVILMCKFNLINIKSSIGIKISKNKLKILQ